MKTGVTSADVLKQEERQRILGVVPNFNTVESSAGVPSLSPGQKFHLMYKSSVDPFVFVADAFVAGISQARNSNPGFGQGAEGYFKRFGASYLDTADGNLWGNAILPIVFKEDPRYFRLGSGTFTHRFLYSAATTVWCKRDNGTWGPNYANVLGNFISGGISNAYYPAADRGFGQTVDGALTVTAEGVIGAELSNSGLTSPDISSRSTRQRRSSAAIQRCPCCDFMSQTAAMQSDLQDVAIAGDHLVQHRVDEETKEEPRYQPSDDYDRKRLLCVRTDACGKRSGQKSEASDHGGHHDRPQPQKASLASCGADVFIFQTQLLM